MELSQQEQKLRKTWLAVLAARLILPFILLFLLVPHAFELDPDVLTTWLAGSGVSFSYDGAIMNATAVFFASMCIALLTFASGYYFVFKKQGTILLTIWLVFGVFVYLGILKELFSGHVSFNTVLEAILYPIWYVLSCKLYRINKRVKLQTTFAKNQADFAQSQRLIDDLRNAVDLQELDHRYRAAIADMPQAELLLTQEYKARKQSL